MNKQIFSLKRASYLYMALFLVSSIGFVEIFYFNKDLYRNWGNTELDPVAFSYAKKILLLLIIFNTIKNYKKIMQFNGLLLYSVFFLPYALYLFFISFNQQAALGALIKDMLPLLFITFGFVHRSSAHDILKFIVGMALLNNLIQIGLIYPLQTLDVIGGRLPFSGAPFFRASGILDVAVYEYLNFIGAIACLIFYKEFKPILFYLFIFFGLLAFSAKSMPIFLALLILGIIKNQTKFSLFIAIGAAVFTLLICLSLLYQDLVSGLISYFQSLFSERIERYINSEDSVRTISYIAAIEELKNGNIFGVGLGMFGGPQATIFQSPLYLKYIPEASQLITVDTYYPHVLIEWGFIGSFIFFSHLFLPLLYKFKSKEGKQFYWAVILFILAGNFVTFAYEDVLRGFIVFPLLFLATRLEHGRSYEIKTKIN